MGNLCKKPKHKEEKIIYCNNYNECKKCTKKFNINFRKCPHHDFSEGRKCVDCTIDRSKFDDSFCYHSK